MAKDAKSSRRVLKKHVKKNVQSGVAHIRSTFNNTIITIIVILMNYSVHFSNFLKSMFANPVFPLADGS